MRKVRCFRGSLWLTLVIAAGCSGTESPPSSAMPDAAAQDSGIFVDAGGLVDAGEDERCTNGLRDIDEEGVDCGGPCASSCSPTACTSTDSAFVPPGYDCVWNEEFGGAVGEGQVRQGLDKQVWIFQNLNVNAEAQNYTNRECSDPEHADDWNYCVEDGVLTIRARDDGIDCRDLDDPDNQPDNPDCALDWNESRGFADYTSGRIITKHTVAFQYGYIEFRARLPQFSRQPESGLWPAIWLLGNNISEGPPPGDTPWPGCGEFDIMEWRSPTNNMGWNALWLGADERLTACSSFPRGGEAVCGPCTGGPCRGVEANEERWLWRGWDAFPHGFYHTYGLLWTPEKMEVFIDGLKMSTFRLGPSETEFQQPMFLIVNLAIGGTLGGAIEVSDWSTAALEVDYLRWYR